MRRPVYDGVPVAVPFEAAFARLSEDPGHWLPDPAAPHPHGHTVVMRASGMLAAAGVPALVDVGPVQHDPPNLAVRTLAWRSLNADRVFPRLVGELELTATSASTSRLTLVGGYTPPISVVGGAADRLFGHHVAEAVIRSFLEDVATGLVAVPAATPMVR